ncbi:transaldolase [Candidatus Woesearchaeota archaeon]|nr:transaldolase [Candidatus Woesearchaeota archaeon]
MRIFIDSAEIEEIKKAKSYGVMDGVTTNPSLIKKAVEARKKVNMSRYISELLNVAKGTPVSLEVIGTNYKDMVAEGKFIHEKFDKVAGNVCIKIPVNPSFSPADTRHFHGLRATRTLVKAGIPVNSTLIFTPEQALLAAKAGASYVSPFAGRIDDHIRQKNRMRFDKSAYFPEEGLEKAKFKDDNGIVSGIDLVEQCAEILGYYDFPTQVLAASLRNTRQVREAALVGADVATLPFDVIEKLLHHHKTFEGMQKFTKDIVPEYQKLLRG